jgi:hypothetical protein
MKKYLPFLCHTLLFLLASVYASHAQDNQTALAVADTSNFSRNANGGWQLYNSYIAAQTVGGDSVRVELILEHENNINWAQEQYVGKIKISSLLPGTEKTMPFSLAGSNYQLRIDTNGKCYLKLASGAAPFDSAVILPFTVIYKK